MLCQHCGADAPEIKIGANSFCSSCGLPLGTEENKQEEAGSSQKNNSRNELSRAFSKMSDTLSTEDTETSYKSSNIGFTKETASNPSQNIERQKVPPVVKVPLVTTVPEKIEPKEEIKKESEPQEILPDIIQAQGKKEPADISKNPIKEVGQPETSEKLLDILQESKGGEEGEIQGKEKQNIKEVYEGAERLLDILKDIPESSEKPKINEGVKQKEELLIESPLGQEEISSPLEKKEILPAEKKPEKKEEIKAEERPLEKITKDASQITETHKEGIPLSEISKIPKAIPEEVEIEAVNIQKGTDNTPKEAVDVVTEWENEEETGMQAFDELSTEEEPEDFRPEKPHKEETKTEPPKSIIEEEEEEEPALPKDIHALGDKSGHIDHWKDEEVKQIDTSELKEGKHPLTSYFENILEKEKTKDKTNKKDKEPVKIKEKKEKKERKTLKIFIAFMISAFVIFLAITVSTKKTPQNIQETKSKALKKINFDFVVPKYLPEGFEESLPLKSSTDSLSITYLYLPDKSKTITLLETSKLPASESDLEDYIKTQGKEYTIEKSGGISIYYTLDQATFKNDKIWVTIKTNFEIEKNELKKITESLL